MLEAYFIYEGFECFVVMRKYYTGSHRCGYVAVDKDHELYGLDYMEIGLEAHGGINYSENLIPGIETDNNLWYFGFSCDHAMDSPPFGYPKSQEFVENECRNIVEQLKNDSI